MKFICLAFLLIFASCGKRANPEVCCIDPADCSSIGAEEDMRECPTGLTCVDHECLIPDCSKQGCPSSAPVCNMATNECDGCSANADCLNFRDEPLCDPSSGMCVQCNVSTDCGPTVPFCDGHTCRKCERDTECASGACADDGTCLGEQQLIFLDPAGSDSGTCSSTQPCRTLPYGVSKSSMQRNHIVMRFGNYNANQITLTESDTTASPLFIHGGNSVLTATSSDGAFFTLTLPVTIRDLEIVSLDGDALTVGPGPAVLERIKIRARVRGIGASGNVTIRDFDINEASTLSGYGIQMGIGTLTLERGVIRNWETAIQAGGMSVLDITNVLFYGSRSLSLEIPNASGNIRFSTVADSGQDAGTGPRAIQCSFNLTIQNSIIWAPGGTPRAAVMGCNLASTIVGPTAVSGASNADPQFANPSARDYHLKPGSPARDMVGSGPALDFERDPRPIGPRFDLGADEAE